MVRTERGNLRFFLDVAVLSSCFLPMMFVTPVAAQDNGSDSRHVRVQFGGGSAWNEIGSNNGAHAPLPAGPAHANYGLSANAQSAPPQQHLRLKPMNFDGM
jgi:hypothetical protein